MRDNMRRDLKAAMKARNQIAVAAIRSALSAMDNAEAVPIEHPVAENGSADVAGSARAGAAEAERRDLSAATCMRSSIER